MICKCNLKKLFQLLVLTALINLQSCSTVTDNNPVNNLKSIPVLRIIASKDDIQNMYNNRFTNFKMPLKLEFNGKAADAFAEASGAGSRYYPKYSFKIELDEPLINNIKVMSISAQVYDRTMMKTVIALYMYEAAGFPVFYSEPVFVTLNNDNFGLYAFIERIEPEFFSSRNISIYELYQVKFDAKFTFTRKNNVKENFEKEIPEDDNYENLEKMIAMIDETNTEDILNKLNKYIDVEEYLMYHAITSARHDPDAFTNNFFLYKETPQSPFRILPWDFDKTFATVGTVGFYRDIDLINKLFMNDSCRAMYKAKMAYVLENIFTEEKLFPIIDKLEPLIEPFYKYDPYLSGHNYKNEVQSIKNFITERRKYLLTELQNFN